MRIVEPAKLTAHDVEEPMETKAGDAGTRKKRGPELTDSLPPDPGALLFAGQDSSTGVFNFDPVPDSVPHSLKEIPLPPVSYNVMKIDPRQSFAAGKAVWVTDASQQAGIALSLKVELYNAADADAKIVRLTTFGTGFSIGDMLANGWTERGVFQDQMSLQLQAPAPLTLGEASPRTENQEATFTSTASTTIRVSGKVGQSEKGGSAEAGGDVSYSVSSSVSTKLSDFQVLDKSFGAIAAWSWEMTKMGGGDPYYTYPYDGPSSLVNFWHNILPLPGLAKSTLFPACQAWWYVPLNFKGQISFQVVATHRTAYVWSESGTLPMAYWAGNAPLQKFAWTVPISFDFD